MNNLEKLPDLGQSFEKLKLTTMKKIFKYPLKMMDDQIISMPEQREILDVQVQEGVIMIWAMVVPNSPMQRVHIEIYGTGHEIKDRIGGGPRMYLGTVQVSGLVLHVFEAN